MPPAPLREQEPAGRGTYNRKKDEPEVNVSFSMEEAFACNREEVLGLKGIFTRPHTETLVSHIEKYSFIGFNVSFYVCGFYVLSCVTM